MPRHPALHHHSDSHRRGRCAHRREGGRHPERDHGHAREHDHERGERSSRRRLFAHGDLRLLALHLIGARPRHGYEIIKEIEDRVAGTYSPSPGVIYPTLTMLEELGHATVAESEGKKLYTITAEGTAYLDANKSAVDQAMAHMQSVKSAHGGGPAPEILRARVNLKMELRLREARGPLTEQQVRDIAAALDAAAVAIERS